METDPSAAPCLACEIPEEPRTPETNDIRTRLQVFRLETRGLKQQNYHVHPCASSNTHKCCRGLEYLHIFYHKSKPHIGKYTIHGACGTSKKCNLLVELANTVLVAVTNTDPPTTTNNRMAIEYCRTIYLVMKNTARFAIICRFPLGDFHLAKSNNMHTTCTLCPIIMEV